MGEYDLTVALPMFRAEQIGWLALEGLARQKNATEISWEVIVAEEVAATYLPMGIDRIMEYWDRLQLAGCRSLQYVPVNSWISLGEKWKLIAGHSQGNIFILQAADCFPQPFRLQETYDLMKSGADWCQSKRGFFYNIRNGQYVVFDFDKYNPPTHKCALNMAMKTEYVKCLPDEPRAHWVDGWIYDHCETAKGGELQVVWNLSDNWKSGFDSCGYHNISVTRERCMAEYQAPFMRPDCEIQVPKYILQRLKRLQDGCRCEAEIRPWEKK